MNFQAGGIDLHKRRTLKRNEVPSWMCQAVAWGVEFPVRFFWALCLINTDYEKVHLVCFLIILFYFVIEKDRGGLRNEVTPLPRGHCWNMISLKCYLISFMCLHKIFAYEVNFSIRETFICSVRRQKKYLTGPRLSTSRSSSRVTPGSECSTSWFRHD